MVSDNAKGGFFEQIQGKINPVVVQYYYGPRFAKSGDSFQYLLTVMEAHVVMLKEEKIIPEDVASKLLHVMEAGTTITRSWIQGLKIFTSTLNI